MFDLAHLWTHGVGWFRHEPDPEKRMACMGWYFEKILEGYRSETDVSGEMLEKARRPEGLYRGWIVPIGLFGKK